MPRGFKGDPQMYTDVHRWIFVCVWGKKICGNLCPSVNKKTLEILL